MKINRFPWRHFITAVFLLAPPVAAQAQFTYITNSDGISITITGYSGPGGTVVIPNTISNAPVTAVGDYAFENGTNLAIVTIAAGVTNIGDDAFAGCTSLTAAYFSENAPANDGTAFLGDTNAIIYYLSGTTGWGATFGGAPAEGETPPSEFGYITNNEAITITGAGVFRFSSGVMTIPGAINGYPVSNLGERAINGVDDVTNIIIPGTITNIGDSAFASIPSLTNVTILNGVTSIGTSAFESCGRLISITIPDSVTSIEKNAFFNCYKLTNISVDAANPAYSSLNGVLFDKAQKTLITYPEGRTNGAYTIPAGVTNIGNNAFAGCASLTAAYFSGNAPANDGTAFSGDTKAVVYYLPGTIGWGPTFGGAPAVLWNPLATTFTTASGQFGFNITGPTNATIVVVACTNLANPVWLPVSTNTLSGSGTSPFTDPQSPSYPNRFYRLRSP